MNDVQIHPEIAQKLKYELVRPAIMSQIKSVVRNTGQMISDLESNSLDLDQHLACTALGVLAPDGDPHPGQRCP
jgi:hypothetical protein